jgi:hypothetical protein
MYRELRKGVTRLTGGRLGTQFTPLDAWPVGSVHLRYDSIDPGTIFGGTWTLFAKGRTIIGVDSTDPDFDTLGETGGAKTHAIDQGMVPPHTHDAGPNLVMNTVADHTHGAGSYTVPRKSAAGGVAGAATGNSTSNGDINVVGTSGAAGGHGHNITGNTGNGSQNGLGQTPLPTMDPYIVTYIWRRTA